MPIATDTIKSLADDELDRLISAAQRERADRAERKRQETIARIRELAETVGIQVAIGGAKGRKPRTKPARGSAGAAKVRKPA
ncbi:MAG TPA: H-NS family nucleoid-associated regulatory protein [Bryobacteraceae bacterium]|nr:H-NS family nucleoid-associated regulatory protein [Bryobacteraceae bacterium]